MSDKILAFISSICPFCRAKRRWPGSSYGRAMRRLEKFCPFCRAYARIHMGGSVKKILVLTVALGGFCGNARALHPLISEDTGFLGKGVRQVETGFEYSAASGGADVYSRSLAAEFSYGLNGKADILLSAPWQGWTSAGMSESGPGDLALEAKFQVAEKAGWVLALKPGLSLPVGDEEKGLGSGRSGFWSYAIAGRASGPWQFYLNAGFLLNKNSGGEEEHIVKASAAAALEIAPGTLVSADLTTETSADPASLKHPAAAIFGLIWSPSENLDLDAGAKFGLNDEADDLGLLAGATFRF